MHRTRSAAPAAAVPYGMHGKPNCKLPHFTAPSGRELSPKATEGDWRAYSLHRCRGPPPSKREAFFASPQGARRDVRGPSSTACYGKPNCKLPQFTAPSGRELSPKATEGDWRAYSLHRYRYMSANVNDLWPRLFVETEYHGATHPLRGSGPSPPPSKREAFFGRIISAPTW